MMDCLTYIEQRKAIRTWAISKRIEERRKYKQERPYSLEQILDEFTKEWNCRVRKI